MRCFALEGVVTWYQLGRRARQRGWLVQRPRDRCRGGDRFQDTTRKMLLIESMAFKNGNKWRVHDGTAAYYALVEDQEFLDKIDAGGGAIREGRRPGRRSTAELAGRS